MKDFTNKRPISQIVRVPSEEGESIEEMLRRQTANKEPIQGDAPMIYTEKADGVRPEFDIRTDRQELALDATDKFSKSERAKTDEAPQAEPAPANAESEQ